MIVQLDNRIGLFIAHFEALSNNCFLYKKKDMKNFVFFTLILLSIQSNAQEKITGFGKIKLGMTIQDLSELNNSRKITTYDDYIKFCFDKTSTPAFELICDTTESMPLGDYDTRVRYFYLGKISITEKISIEKVELKFFNDTLYYINVMDSKLRELLKTKYGDGKIEKKTEEKTYINGMGIKIVKLDESFTTSWNTGIPDTRCEYYFSNYHNDRGEERYIYYGQLQNTRIMSLVTLENMAIKERLKENEKARKKSELEGF